MKTIFHPASDRGHADHGWLNAHHSFSFASWYDPAKVHFGMLRVLNDDIVAGGQGFGTHPHNDMEIVTFVRTGAITHRDSLGNEGRTCLLYTSPSPRDRTRSRMPSSA